MDSMNITLGILLAVSGVWSFMFVCFATVDAFDDGRTWSAVGGVFTIVLGILAIVRIFGS